MSDIQDPELVRARVPDHVVYREFPLETVVLNVSTGQYHGLNPVASAILDELNRATSIAGAVDALTAEFDAPREQVDSDVRELCASLLDRGLIIVEPSASA